MLNLASAGVNRKASVKSTGISAEKMLQLHRIGSESSIFGLLDKFGFSEHHRREILKSAIIPQDLTLAKGDVYLVRTSKDGGRVELKLYHRIKEEAYVFWRQQDRAGLTIGPAQFEHRKAHVEGRVHGSLITSITDQTHSEDLGYRMMDAYQFRYPKLSKKLKRGARYSITYEELVDGGNFIRIGQVLKTMLEVDGNFDERYFVEYDGGGAFVSKSDLQQDRDLYAPVKYVRISSLFQPHRMHPITRRRIPHMGVDFELPSGESVYAVGSGTIKRTGRTRGAGRFVVIDHGGGIQSYYDHLSEIKSGVDVGRLVQAGDEIAAIGCTGYCTRPHLHLAISKNGKFLDPLGYLKSYSYRQRTLVASLLKTTP